MANASPQSEDTIFSLDIGTRSITGIVGHLEGGLFHVDACESVPHARRSMIDGQIEDIGQVALVGGLVKQKLEAALGCELTKVSVAAAGRALKTFRAQAAVDLSPALPVTAQQVYELESTAVNEARALLGAGEAAENYYCVAYSVVRYHLDGYPFGNIVGHCGKLAEVEIIATFLPTEVVGSLQRCMEMLGLEIDTFTLEPIAAMRAVIPQDVRLLNLALVDVGAGTSDIALSRDGTVAGYTMATMAGDEVTEAIIKRFLVDFETAEAMKTTLTEGGTVQYTDILGKERTLPAADVMAAVDLSVDLLAKTIADKTFACNDGPPTAMFLVGGGSKTPGLVPKLAEKLALEEDRIALGGTSFKGNVEAADDALRGPEYATPLGIALLSADSLASGGAFVHINGRKVRLFAGHTPSVMDALLMSGYRYSDLMGRHGRTLTFTLNGEKKTIRGGGYTVAEVTLNGHPAALTSPVANGDVLDITPAASGEDAAISIARLCENVCPSATALVNGVPAPPDYMVAEFDDVEILPPAAEEPAQDAPETEEETVAEAAEEMPPEPAAAPGFAKPDTKKTAPTAPTESTRVGEADAIAAAQPPPQPLHITLNGRRLALPPKIGGGAHTLADMLPLVDIDPANTEGRLLLQVNGTAGAIADVLKNDDDISIIWEGNA